MKRQLALLEDFISALYWSKIKVSAFIIAPPSSGKSFTLRKVLHKAKGVEFTSKITEAGLRKLLFEKPRLHTIVFSDATINIHQKQDYSIWNAVYEATEEGLSTFQLGTQSIQLGKRRIAFIIALTEEDFYHLQKKLQNRVNVEALLSRFLIFNYNISSITHKEITSGNAEIPKLQYPKFITTHSEELLKHIQITVAHSIHKEYLPRIVRNTYYVSLAFYEITGDLEMAKRFSSVLIGMRNENERFYLEDAQKYVYNNFQEYEWREKLKNAIMHNLR